MNTIKILHGASHIKWIMFIWSMGLMIYGFIEMPDNILSISGRVVFLLGIFLGLDSLSDFSRMSEKSRIWYQDKKNTRR